MLRKTVTLLLLTISFGSMAQQFNVERSAQWAEGRCEAVFQRGDYTFIGNGAYLQVYTTNASGSLDPYLEILLPGAIKDIWVESTLNMIYAVCGHHGLILVELNTAENTLEIISTVPIQGDATGVGFFNKYVYVAAGTSGLLIYGVHNYYQPKIEGYYLTSNPAMDVWVVNDSLALLAVHESGLFSVNTKKKDTPVVHDSLGFAPAFQGFPISDPQAKNVIISGTVAYVAAGYGGLRTVDYSDPENLVELGSWTDSLPLDVVDMRYRGNRLFIACGEEGLVGPIDISNPAAPGSQIFPALNTEGYTNRVWIKDDSTALVCDGPNGLLLVDVKEGQQSSVTETISPSDYAYDAFIDNNMLYVADGRAGLKIISLSYSQSDKDHLPVYSSFNTQGEVRGVTVRQGYAFLADGTAGLRVLDVITPANPVDIGQYSDIEDACYDVDIYQRQGSSYALLACGTDGFIVLDYSGFFKKQQINTPGVSKKILVSDNRAILVDSSSVFVYNIIDLPALPVQTHALTNDIDAYGMAIVGDTLFVANGRYGFLLWNLQTNGVQRVTTGGNITDIQIIEKTIYLTDSESGLRVFDFSTPGLFPETGYYNTNGEALALDISASNGVVAMADGSDGVYLFRSSIQPDIAIYPESPLQFGPVIPGQSRPRILNVINEGTTLLRVDNITWLNSWFHFDDVSFTVAPGEMQQVEVTFSPPVTAGKSTQIDVASIYSNDPDEPVIELTLQAYVDTLNTSLPATRPYTRDEFTIGLYHLDDESIASSVQDASILEKDAFVQGEPTQENSQSGFNKAVRLDGESDYLQIPYHSHLNFEKTPFTVELWFNIVELPSGYAVLMRRGNNETRQVELALDNQTGQGLMGSVWDSGGNQHTIYSGSIGIFNVNQWYHAAFTWDMDSLVLYLNGDPISKAAMSNDLRPQTSEPMAIGATSTGYLPFNGLIDEIHISSIARQSWEFHVNRARISIQPSPIEFGYVLMDQTRRVPVTIYNRGSQILTIANLYTPSEFIDEEVTLPINLMPQSSTIIWMTYHPDTENDHADGQSLVIVNSDPTFPTYNVPIRGRSVSNFRAGRYEADPFTLGLYHFDDNTPLVASDSSGQEMDGAFKGSTTYDASIRKFDEGFSVKFKNTADRILVKPGSEDRFGPVWGGFTVETWFRIDRYPITQSVIIRRGNVAANQFDMYIDNGGRIIGRMYNTEQDLFEVNSSALGAVQLNQWYHTALVQREDSLYLYVNGNSVDSRYFGGTMASDQSHTILDTLSMLVGGDWLSANAFSGNVDEVRISGVGRDTWEFNVNMARISVSPSQLNFGDVFLGSSRTLELSVNNMLGMDTLFVDSIAIDLDAYYQSDTQQFYLLQEESRRIRITFKALTLGSHPGALTFYTNDPFWPERKVNLSGSGIPTIEQEPYPTDPFTLSLFHLDSVGVDGVTVGDFSGNGKHGTLHDQVAISDTGRFGGGLRFYGGYFELPSEALEGKVSAYFTVENWFRLSALPNTGALIVQRALGDNTKQFEIAFTSGENSEIVARIWNQLNQGFTLHGPESDDFNLEQWYHVSLSIDGSWARLMVNGLVQDSVSFIGDILSLAGGSVRYGSDIGGSRVFYGFMDEIRISNIDRKAWELNVIPPQIILSAYQLPFDQVKLGFTRTMNLIVTNPGDQTLTIHEISGADTIFSIPENMQTFSLNRLQSVFLPVTFKPVQATSSYARTLTIQSNAKNSPQTAITLTGTGYLSPGSAEYAADGYTVMLYHFNESHGDTIFDNSGNRLNGFLWNGSRIVNDEGFFDACIRFDGYNDRVEIPGDELLQNDFHTQSLTLECYFKTDTVSQVLIGKGFQDSLMQGDLIVGINNFGRVTVNGIDGVGPRVNDNAWHHLAFVYDHQLKTGRMFVDFTEIWSETWNTDLETADLVRPLLLGAAERKNGGYAGYFQGYLDELRFSTINREIWSMNPVIDAGIRPTALTPATPYAGDQITLTLNVPVAVNASSMTLYYRQSGRISYQTANAFPENDQTFRAVIPSEAVTLRGVEYYVEVVSSTQHMFTYPVMDPVNKPKSIPIRFESMQTQLVYTPQRMSTGRYQLAAMFSVPFFLDHIGADTVFTGISIKDYDPFQWRLFWWDPARSQVWYNYDPEGIIYVEFSDLYKGSFSMPPGRAYWLVSNIERQFSLRGGHTVSTDTSFQKELQPGWNMVGNPYNFTIKWSDCSLSSAQITPPYGWEGEDGYRPDTPYLEPWKGYWFFNASPEPGYLFIHPEDASLSKTAGNGRGLLDNLEETSWIMQISVSDDYSCDKYNYAGVREHASMQVDLYDRPEPPRGFANGVSLTFEHADWEEKPNIYAADIRPTETDGQVWKLSVLCGESQTRHQITWNHLSDLPENWKAYLIDFESEVAVDLMKDRLYGFNSDPDNMSRTFKMIAGTAQFLEKNREGISLEPVDFALLPNSPNPFNPVTTINFTLPQKSDVRISIYNALGQRVRYMVEKDCHAGKHAVEWDATDDRGMKLPTGVYVYQLKAANKTAVRKMVLIK
ncbi:choice-of-anchor D domain-containing protein [bacterium]|nr:choice-of-anchor D domain-containing protein [bacterium]